MSIQVVCPACQTQRVVRDEMVGKRIRCPGCQTVVKVVAAFDPEIEESIEDDLPPAQRRRKSPRKGALNPFQRFVLFAARNPWLGLSLLYLGVWVPASLLAPLMILRINVLAMLLCWVGVVVGVLLAFAGVAMQNPFQMLSIVTVGALAAMLVPPERMALRGRRWGRMLGSAGLPSVGDADTGAGGQMATYCGVLSVVLLGHITVLAFLVAGQM